MNAIDITPFEPLSYALVTIDGKRKAVPSFILYHIDSPSELEMMVVLALDKTDLYNTSLKIYSIIHSDFVSTFEEFVPEKLDQWNTFITSDNQNFLMACLYNSYNAERYSYNQKSTTNLEKFGDYLDYILLKMFCELRQKATTDEALQALFTILHNSCVQLQIIAYYDVMEYVKEFFALLKNEDGGITLKTASEELENITNQIEGNENVNIVVSEDLVSPEDTDFFKGLFNV